MQSHIWDRTVATIVKQKLFFIHLRLSLFYLSLSYLHFFLLSLLRRCGSPMSVHCWWLWFANGRGLWSNVLQRFYGSGFMGLGSWVCVLWSKYFEVGSYDCRLLVYPKGESQALPGYISIYLQIMDPRGTSSLKWDCFASYRLAIANVHDNSKTIHRDSWHRFGVVGFGWVEIGVVGFGWGWERGGWVVTKLGWCGWGVGLGFDGFCLLWPPWVLGLWALFAAASLSSSLMVRLLSLKFSLV